MSVDPVSLSAFRDEMEKISYRKAAIREAIKAFSKGKGAKESFRHGRKLMAEGAREAKFMKDLARKPGEGTAKHWLRKGWMEAGGPHGGMGGWGGKIGTWREKVPIGGKSLAVGGTAVMAPSALKKEDPTGRGRSRTERAAQLLAGTAGGIAGVGAVMRAGKPSGLLRTLAGGMAGGMGAEYAAGLPFRRSRQIRMQGPIPPEQRAQLLSRALPPQQPGAYR